MTIPDFQSLMRPLLELHADRQEHTNRDLVNALADSFGMTDEQRREMLPSGRAKLFDNRVGWAKTYIANAGLIVSPRRAISVITDLGQDVLARHKGPINLRFLSDLPDKPNKSVPPPPQDRQVEVVDISPQEAVENAHQKIRRDVERSLLDKIS